MQIERKQIYIFPFHFQRPAFSDEGTNELCCGEYTTGAAEPRPAGGLEKRLIDRLIEPGWRIRNDLFRIRI